MLRALVLRAPGINCDRETAYACDLAGFDTDLVHINFLRKKPERLLDYAFLVIPGGFSYGDDLGAGTLLAKNLTIHLERQLRQFVDEGRPVLGICNGFQALVRAGLLPGCRATTRVAPTGRMMPGNRATTRVAPTPGMMLDSPDMFSGVAGCSLTENASAQFECRWVTLFVEPSVCIFTQGREQSIELPVAHGEGRFVAGDTSLLISLQTNGQVPLVYAKGSRSSVSDGDEMRVVPYPDNPNGSVGNIAGICNAQGNVFGLMPHPERYVRALQHPQRRETDGGEGDGLFIFKNAYEYAKRREEIDL